MNIDKIDPFSLYLLYLKLIIFFSLFSSHFTPFSTFYRWRKFHLKWWTLLWQLLVRRGYVIWSSSRVNVNNVTMNLKLRLIMVGKCSPKSLSTVKWTLLPLRPCCFLLLLNALLVLLLINWFLIFGYNFNATCLLSLFFTKQNQSHWKGISWFSVCFLQCIG